MNLYPSGSRIADRYEVAGRPLIGGMGIVYLCYDHNDQRPVALKTFKPEYLPDRATRDRFLREGDTWIKLGRHPHIVRAYGVERVGDGTEVYLVLELIAKEQGREDASLRSWLTPCKPIPSDQVLLFAMQVVRGMQHATTVVPGFVHRDLKPENLLIGSDKLTKADINRLRITDFGLASILGGLTSASVVNENDLASFGRIQLTHGIVGTPLYMAPEQWRGEKVSVATDIYALGCIVFEMLAGVRIVEGETLTALQVAHCDGKHKPIPAHVPARLRGWVERCVATSQSARYASWQEVESGLDEVYRAATDTVLPMVEPEEATVRTERVAVGWSKNEIGRSYLDLGQTQVALANFEQAHMTGIQEGERHLEGAALGNLGEAYNDLGATHQAIACYEQSLIIYRETKNRRGEGATFGDLGVAYKNLGDVHRAIDYYEQALAMFREIGDRQAESISLGNLGVAYFNLGDAKRAIGFAEQRLKIAREIGDQRGEGAALANLGNAHISLGNEQYAIDCLEKQLSIALGIGDRYSEGNALGNLGIVHLHLGDGQRAINYFAKQLNIARETGDRRNECFALGNMGNTCKILADGRRSINYFEQQLTLSREIGNRRAEGNALGSLGNAYADAGDTRRAMEFYEQQLSITREIGDMSGEAVGSANMALLYRQLGNTVQARREAEHALTLFRQIGSPNSQRMENLIAEWQDGLSVPNEPDTEQSQQHLAAFVAVIVEAARGSVTAKQQVERVLERLTQAGFPIVESIQHIWEGERDESKLTEGLDATNSFIVREILKQLMTLLKKP